MFKTTNEIKLDNYETFRQEINENTTNIFAKLEPVTTRLIVSSIPSNADVYIDDNLLGKTPLNIKDMAEGTYKLKVKTTQYETYEETITLKKG